MSEWAPEVCTTCRTTKKSLSDSQAEVARLARIMSKSDRAQAKYMPQLKAAKAQLGDNQRVAETHAAECEGISEAPHGSVSRYCNRMCRCELCRDAWRRYAASRRPA